jgi:hypothetical protein
MRPDRLLSTALAPAAVLAAAACNRAAGGGSAAQNAPADSTAAAAQKRDTLPKGVTVDTQKVAGEEGRETPQQDQDEGNDR